MIVVIGEAFFDQYHIGEATRLSPEFPGPVVKIQRTIELMGGAYNVFMNLLALGEQDAKLFHQPSAFPVKNRLMVGDTQIARWDEDDTVEPFNLNSIRSAANILRYADGIIFSDYAKGAFSVAAVTELRSLIPSDTPVFIDTKRSPRYFDAFGAQAIFFPNDKEWNEFKYDYREVTAVHKSGAHGMTFVRPYPSLDNYHVDARKVVPVSVNGAGDTVIAAFASAWGKPSIDDDKARRSTRFANDAAAVVVQKPLTATASLEEIERVRTL